MLSDEVELVIRHEILRMRIYHFRVRDHLLVGGQYSILTICADRLSCDRQGETLNGALCSRSQSN